MSLLRVIILWISMAIAVPSALCAAPTWENVPTTAAPSTTEDTSDETITVNVRDGYIYVTTTRPTTVRVMTILGQLISQYTVPEGTSRLKVVSRGIYILKAGGQTIRVTI